MPLRLQARELKSDHAGAWAVDIGQPTGSRAVFFTLCSDGNEATFFWDDGRHLVTRRMPSSLAGYDLIERLAAYFCPRRGRADH
ncbi:MAG: hypothetical protein M3P29_12075 [Acidobacteriota bacterium]|nr:hypothetical protein [Acidobacteriota bacterium]